MTVQYSFLLLPSFSGILPSELYVLLSRTDSRCSSSCDALHGLTLQAARVDQKAALHHQQQAVGLYHDVYWVLWHTPPAAKGYWPRSERGRWGFSYKAVVKSTACHEMKQ